MADQSRIEWTEATWNPVTGCHKVSQGCKNCYAERDWVRLAGNPTQPAYHGRAFTDVRCHPERLKVPIDWARPRRIFVNSMSDLFHEAVPFEFIDKVFAVMSITCRHTYQVLTKRPARMLEYFKSRCETEDFELTGYPEQIDAVDVYPEWKPLRKGKPGGGYDNCGPAWPLINVQLGVSIEDQATADERIPILLECPAAIRFVSAEPLLAPTYLARWLRKSVSSIDFAQRVGYQARTGIGDRLDWVIVGGESGPRARPTQLAWVRELRDECGGHGVPFFFKQWGEYVPAVLDAKPFEEVPWRTYPDGDRRWMMSELAVPREEWPEVTMVRVGRRQAGHLLDGAVHHAQPTRTPWPLE